MLKRYLRHESARFAGRYDYDTAYLDEIIDVDPRGAFKLGLVSFFTEHRFGIPAKVYYAAKVTAAWRTDCGSCLRLVIAMAEEAGVARKDIATLLVGAEAEKDDAMSLAARYAEAMLSNDPQMQDLVEAARDCWGPSAPAGLAAATVSGVFYPLLKRGLGHGNACEPVIALLAREYGHDTVATSAHAG